MIRYDEQAQTFTIHTKNTTYQMAVHPTGVLQHVYYGRRLRGCDLRGLIRYVDRGFSPNPAQLPPILRELDARAKAAHADPKTAILQGEAGREIVHMAHLDIHFGYSVNGVAALHTDILKSSELRHFHDIYPDKFNNKTNG